MANNQKPVPAQQQAEVSLYEDHLMTETAILLALAHVLADFILQPRSWVDSKASPGTLAKHGAVVLAAAVLATGSVHPALLALALAHVLIDVAKEAAIKRRVADSLALFALDQGCHALTIVAVAFIFPGLWSDGYYTSMLSSTWETLVISGALLLTGFIIVSRVGQFAIQYLMERFILGKPKDSLRYGGAAIGLLERSFIFFLVIADQLMAVGFLLAAKSLLRFGTATGQRRSSEYLIIGTLASFGWALLVAGLTVWCLKYLPPA